MLLGFAKAHHQIAPEKKQMGVALGYGSCPKLGASHLIFLQRLELVIVGGIYMHHFINIPVHDKTDL